MHDRTAQTDRYGETPQAVRCQKNCPSDPANQDDGAQRSILSLCAQGAARERRAGRHHQVISHPTGPFSSRETSTLIHLWVRARSSILGQPVASCVLSRGRCRTHSAFDSQPRRQGQGMEMTRAEGMLVRLSLWERGQAERHGQGQRGDAHFALVHASHMPSRTRIRACTRTRVYIYLPLERGLGG